VLDRNKQSVAYALLDRVTACLENLEMSGNLTAVREMAGIVLKVREVSGTTSCQALKEEIWSPCTY